MASYADMAKRGPKQSPEDAAAPQLDEVQPSDESVASLIDVDSGVSVVSHDFPDQEVQTETQEKRIEMEDIAREERKEREEAEARRKARQAAGGVQSFINNPIYMSSAVLSGVLAVVLGIQGYKKYSAGKLSWKLVGIWTGAVALYGTAEYYATQFLNKKYHERK